MLLKSDIGGDTYFYLRHTQKPFDMIRTYYANNKSEWNEERAYPSPHRLIARRKKPLKR